LIIATAGTHRSVKWLKLRNCHVPGMPKKQLCSFRIHSSARRIDYRHKINTMDTQSVALVQKWYEKNTQ
jgi:hypothetical protein